MTTRLPITNTMAFIPSNDQSKMSSDLVDVEVTTTTTTTTTTPGPYRIRVGTLQSLIRRNIRGLVRLFNIEWQEAMNVSCCYLSRCEINPFSNDIIMYYVFI